MNSFTLIGLSSAIALAGVGISTENIQLTTVGVNLGISGAAFASISQKSQAQQERDRLTQTEMVALKQQLTSLQEVIEQDQVQQTVASLTTQQQQLDFKINNTQQQLKNHSKKLKKQQHNFNIQQANQNRIFSRVQKLENKQQKLVEDREVCLEQVTLKIDKPKANIQPSENAQELLIEQDLVVKREPQHYGYIDNNNLYKCLESEGIAVDYGALLIKLTQGANNQIKLYDGAFPNQAFKYQQLQKIGYQTKTFPIAKRGQGKFKTIGDDLQLGIDLVRDVQSGDRVTLVSGDGDLFPALKAVKEQSEVSVTVIAKSTAVSQQLLAYADEFIPLESIMYDIAKYTNLSA